MFKEILSYMLNFKICITETQSSKRKDGTFNVKVRVTYNRKVIYIKTAYYILPHQIDKNTGKLDVGFNSITWNKDLQRKISSYHEIYSKYRDRIPFMNIDDIVELLESNLPENNYVEFIPYAKIVILELKEAGKTGSVGTYNRAINHLEDVRKNKPLYFQDMDLAFLTKFEKDLHILGLKTNTIGIYFRNIRTVFNKAISAGYISQEIYPFKKFKISKEKTKHRNIEVEDLKILRSATFESYAWTRSRDLFFLSFYLIGINFKDLLLLEKKQIRKNMLSYYRHKTDKLYSFDVPIEAMQIIEKYKGEDLLLRFVEERRLKFNTTDRDNDFYRIEYCQTNKMLKLIVEHLQLDIDISTYYARHSWATIASDLDIPEETIIFALGHKPLNDVTDVYIRRQTKKINEANRKVIDAIM